MNRKVIIGAIVLVLIVIVVAAVAASGDDDKSEKDPETPDTPDTPAAYIEANWRTDVGHTITDSSGVSTTADEGKEYVVLTYTITNNLERTVSLNPLVFEWEIWADNVSYSFLLGTSAVYLDGYSTSSVATGGTSTQVLAYELPDGAVVQDVSVSYMGIDDVSKLIHRDTSIQVSAPAGLS